MAKDKSFRIDVTKVRQVRCQRCTKKGWAECHEGKGASCGECYRDGGKCETIEVEEESDSESDSLSDKDKLFFDEWKKLGHLIMESQPKPWDRREMLVLIRDILEGEFASPMTVR